MKKLHLIILLLFAACSYTSCKKATPDFNIDNMEDKVLILGHAGMGINNFYPINSAESIMTCLNAGANGTEMDVQMTKDSVLVTYHDETLETQTDGEGAIIDYTWKELQKVRYKASPYINYSILAIDDLFGNLDNIQQLTFSFDNKLYFDKATQAVFMRAIIRLLEKYKMESNVFIESRNIGFLKDFKVLRNYKFFMNPVNFETGLMQADTFGLYGIIMENKNITAEQIAIAHQHAKRVQIWGPVTRDENIEAIQMNPDAVQTDNINAMVDLLQ